MLNHSCAISAVLAPKEGIGFDEIKAGIEPFLSAYDLDFDVLVAQGDIDFEGQILNLGIPFSDSGNGFKNKHIDALVLELGKLFLAPDYIEVLDRDIGDPSLSCVPRFIGDEREQNIGRLQYGFVELADRVRSIVPYEKLQEIEQFILGISGYVDKPIPSVI